MTKKRKIQVRHLFALDPAVFPPQQSCSESFEAAMFSPRSTARRQEPPASQRSPRAPVSLQVSSIVPETTDDTARPKAFPLATSLALAGDVFSAALVLALPFCKAIGGRFYQKNLQGMYGQWLLNNIFSIMFPKAHVKKKNK